MRILKKIKDRAKKEIHFQKLGYKEAARRIKAGLKKKLEEAKENQRQQRAFKEKLKAAEQEGLKEEMLKAAKDIGREKARAKAKAILGEKQGFTIRMPDLWGFEDENKRKQKKDYNS